MKISQNHELLLAILRTRATIHNLIPIEISRAVLDRMQDCEPLATAGVLCHCVALRY
jgi:hypothetical protein